jgi:hypothetical protein
MKALMRKRWLWEALVAVVLAAATLLAFWLGQQRALSTLSVQQVSPDQAATAMVQDEFYSDYNEATLLIRGSVASVNVSGSTSTVVFATKPGTEARCQMNQPLPAVKTGTTVTVVTEGSQAQRLPSGGVLLGNCIPVIP